MKRFERADSSMMSAASFVEASIVIESSGYDGLRDFDLFVASASRHGPRGKLFAGVQRSV